MSATIAKIDYESLNLFQREMHTVRPEEEIYSTFQHDYRRMTWYTKISEKLQAGGGEDELIFRANSTYHYLLDTTMHQVFPAIRVKEKFRGHIRICWPHNLGHYNFHTASLKFDNENPQNIDPVWLDQFSQWFGKPGFRDLYNQCVGNVPLLEEWSEFLPEYTTTVKHPWYYHKDSALGIPLFLCSASVISFTYKLRRKIIDLLRMQALRDVKDEKGNILRDDKGKPLQEWVPCKCEPNFLDGLGSSGLLPHPELWGSYAYIDPTEVDYWKCKTEHTFYIEDVIMCNSLNTTTYGSGVSVDLDCKTPCKAIFWNAENIQASKFNNFANYTTDTGNVYMGWDPCEKVELKYGNVSRLPEMHHHHFDRMEAIHNFPSAPTDAGYHAFAFTSNIMSLDAEPGIVMTGMKAKFIVNINNTDPYLKPVRGVEKDTSSRPVSLDELELDAPASTTRVNTKNTPQFTVHVRLLVTRKLTWTWKPDKKAYIAELDTIQNSDDSLDGN